MSITSLLNLAWASRYVLAFVAIFSLGFGMGHHQAEVGFDAEQSKANKALVQDVIRDARQAIEESRQVEADVQKSNAIVSAAKTAARPRIFTLKDHAQTFLPADDLLLDRGTVRLLNDAAEVPTSAASPGSDGESETTAGTPVTSLINHNFEITKLYRELAIRHDALVDWIETENKKRSGN